MLQFLPGTEPTKDPVQDHSHNFAVDITGRN